MEISAEIFKKTNHYISTQIKWSKVRFNPSQEKNYKITKRIGDYMYKCTMKINEDVRDWLIGKGEFVIDNDTLNISFDGKYFSFDFREIKVIKRKIKGRTVNYYYAKSIAGYTFNISLMKRLKFEKSNDEEIRKIKRERKRKINQSKHFVDNPYPVRAIYRGGSMTPK